MASAAGQTKPTPYRDLVTDVQHRQVWHPPGLGPAVAQAYLSRLGRSDPPPPTAAALRDLHARHVERIPYETLWLHLGEQRGIDPSDSAAHVAAGRGGGYCYHLNGAFSALLTTLGYDVQWHVGGVQRRGGESPGADSNHLVLTVHQTSHSLPRRVRELWRTIIRVAAGRP